MGMEPMLTTGERGCSDRTKLSISRIKQSEGLIDLLFFFNHFPGADPDLLDGVSTSVAAKSDSYIKIRIALLLKRSELLTEQAMTTTLEDLNSKLGTAHCSIGMKLRLMRMRHCPLRLEHSPQQ